MTSDLITVGEAAKILFRDKKRFYSVHRLIYKNRFRKAKKIGWVWVLSRKEVLKVKEDLKALKNLKA